MDLYKRKGTIITFDDGLKILIRAKTILTERTLYKNHIVKEGETLESIAFKEYKAGGYWLMLMDINTDIFNPFELEVGSNVILPRLNSVKYESNIT